MGDRTCAEIRSYLIDSFGSKDGLPAADLRHLETCGECARFLELHGLLTARDERAAPDYRSVDLAFEEAGRISRRRRDARETAAFLAAGLCVTGTFSAAGLLGFGVFVLIFQAFLFLTVPISAFFIVRNRLKGDWAWEER